jgi:hypothetical protein
MTDEQIEAKIEEFFHRNYEMLRAEGGRPLTGHMRKKALNQVRQYYAKMKEVAKQVTETEVKLTLPGQRTPEGRRFSIEGVVDIVREGETIVMYDIKTHEPDMIRDNQDLYAEQLNVYAHIYQELRGNRLDETAIICTQYPRGLEQAMRESNPARIAREFDAWDPVVPIPFDQDGVAAMVGNFGRVVDRIEDKDFAPPPLDRLLEKFGTGSGTFASKICTRCDARFSCESYRAFARSKYGRGFDFRRFFAEDRDEVEQEEWVVGNLET